MAWKETNVEKLAKSLGVNAAEIKEKQKLIELITEARQEKGLSQAALAKRLGVSQGRIAQIESGVGTAKVTFDVLLNVLRNLGYEIKITPRKDAQLQLESLKDVFRLSVPEQPMAAALDELKTDVQSFVGR